ncbi:putative CRM domain-containing protein At3g25440, chloroplastic isoform X1 [Silene latifolia]|uniref:putative CRM domain-containing protein At3g25440, chloroplastic isoform X1 n=2 Tax=Silene latifolia TaxID=37657 RepID=UPI003D788891
MWRRRNLFCSSFSYLIKSIPLLNPNSLLHIPCSFHGVLSKAFVRDPAFGPLHVLSITHHHGFHSTPFPKGPNKDESNTKQTQSRPAAQDSSIKVKRKKLKGKRAVVRWLKHFRYKKKKEYQRMTSEEKILYKLNKARNKEAKLLDDLKKLEPKEWSETTHDPEVLTPEEHFYFLKMGLKSKNYVPIGRRGIYQGVILNMHLHWKKHQTLQVIVKTFTPEEVKEIATELARLTGGIVLDIQEEDTIIMYRGKNYAQPPTEIMSPRVTLPRKKALDKSKHRDALRAVRRYIPRLEQELELLRAQHQNRGDHASEQPQDVSKVDAEDDYHAAIPNSGLAPSNKLKALMDQYKNTVEEDGSMSDGGMGSESEDLSDMFETDSDTEGNAERPLYLHQFDKFPANNKKEGLHLMSMDPKRIENADLAEFDEVDQIFIRAAELLRKKRK